MGNRQKVLMINITPFDKAIDGPLSQSSDFWVFVFLTLNTNTHGMWTMSNYTNLKVKDPDLIFCETQKIDK